MPAAQDRPLARAAASSASLSPPRTSAPRERARAPRRPEQSWEALCARVDPRRVTRIARAEMVLIFSQALTGSSGPRYCPCLTPTPTSARTHTHPRFHKNWKSRPTLRGGHSGTCHSAYLPPPHREGPLPPS